MSSLNHSVMNFAWLFVITGIEIPTNIYPIKTNSNQVLINILRMKPIVNIDDAILILKLIPLFLIKYILGIEHIAAVRYNAEAVTATSDVST